MRYPVPDKAFSEKYRALGYWRDDTVPALFAKSLAQNPEKLAVRDSTGASVTYAQLDAQSASVAGFLAAQGLGKGDVVTVCLPNWVDTVVIFLGIMRIGAVVNPVPVTYGRADLTFVMGKCDSRALFTADRFRSTNFNDMLSKMDPGTLDNVAVVTLGDDVATGRTAYRDVLNHAPFTGTVNISADDPAVILFTSGTESKPKGVVHSHNTMLFGERTLAQALSIGADDVAFMASPISHTTGYMHGVIMTLMTGGTLSLLDVFKGGAAATQMAEHGCTWTMGATPFLADISAALREKGETLPTMRYFLCGGAPIPESLARAGTDVGFHVLSVYGSTESPPHTIVLPTDPISNAWTTDGRALPGIEVRVVAEGGVDAPLGEPGEEWSRGPNTFLGYLGEPELTARDLDADGWYHSGDLARMTEDGSIRVTGRLKEIIVRGGQNISVREVEDYLMAHPAVLRAAVVGIPHDRLGETGCAIIVPKDGQQVTFEEMIAYLKSKGVAMFKLPERMEIWPELPMNASGKIQKFIIRQKLAETDGGKPE